MDEAKAGGSVRERLLDAADALFYREGVHTVGIDRILEQAGVAKASLYGTFGSKEALVRAYLERRAQRLEARLEARSAEFTDPREQILAIFDAYAERVAEADYFGCPFARACAERPLDPSAAREVTLAHRAWRHALFARLLAELGVRDTDVVTRQLSILFDGVAVGAIMDGDPIVTQAAREAVEQLLDAQRAPRRKTGGGARSHRKART